MLNHSSPPFFIIGAQRSATILFITSNLGSRAELQWIVWSCICSYLSKTPQLRVGKKRRFKKVLF